jgi:hypothetical protein
MRILFILVLAITVASCHRDHVKPACNTPATIIDLNASGCEGLGFKLSDGSLLMPVHSFCGFGDDPLAKFEMIAGQAVIISYDVVQGSSCGNITSAAITCITLADPDEK